MISDTGRGRPARDFAWEGVLTEAPKRKNRFAFSREPASLRRIEPRRLCLGNCVKLWPTAAGSSGGRRPDLERRRSVTTKGRGSGETRSRSDKSWWPREV